ncbi:MAG: sigma-70 family RNA polymerase sigma factor [Phycisphaerales bacterium]
MERAQFERLALEQLDAVYRLALHLTRQQDRAEDLVQDVYARAFRPNAIASFEDRSGGDGPNAPKTQGDGIRSWLFTICHNLFYSKAKRASLAPSAVPEFFDEQSTERLPDEPPPAWDLASLDWEQVDQSLKKAIDDLKPEYREVLLLWGVEGLKYREIGTILEVPIGTVMSRLHRARKLLADALAESGYFRAPPGSAAGGNGKPTGESDGEGGR